MRKLMPLLFSLLLLAACNQPEKAKEAQRAAPAFWPGKMALTITPTRPLTGKDVTFRAHVTDPSGQPVTNARVRAALNMLTMDMGKNEIELANKGNGDYEGTGKFTMAGTWGVDLMATTPSQSGQQTFPVEVNKE